MVFAVPYLAQDGIEANARVCRSVAEGLAMLRARRREGRLPAVVVLALGANSPVRPVDVETALRVLGPGRRLGLVTHRTWFGKPGPDTRAIRQIARAHPDRIRLIDWVAYSRPHAAWFGMDGLHPTQAGARRFANLIARAAG
jgi:lysophospholipase L1-like esterase